MDAKTKAIVAHITLIGWIVALVLNQGEQKEEFAAFYIRQMLGLIILAIGLIFVPIVGWILNIAVIALWVISLVNALGQKEVPLPIIGSYFQEWFKSL